MKRIHFIVWCILCVCSVLLFSCKQKDLKPKPEDEIEKKIEKLNSAIAKVEKVAIDFATTDTNLGEYDSIKFVSCHPYNLMEYCQFMQQIITKQGEKTNAEMDQAILEKNSKKLVDIDQQLADIREATDFYAKTIYNMKITKDNPTVMYEAKCYVYTDGYIFEPVYYLNKEFEIMDLDPYNFDFIK